MLQLAIQVTHVQLLYVEFVILDLEKTEAIPHTVRTRGANYGVVSKAYRSENSGKAVIITADIQDIVEIGETFNKDHTYIDLGNFGELMELVIVTCFAEAILASTTAEVHLVCSVIDQV